MGAASNRTGRCVMKANVAFELFPDFVESLKNERYVLVSITPSKMPNCVFVVAEHDPKQGFRKKKFRGSTHSINREAIKNAKKIAKTMV